MRSVLDADKWVKVSVEQNASHVQNRKAATYSTDIEVDERSWLLSLHHCKNLSSSASSTSQKTPNSRHKPGLQQEANEKNTLSSRDLDAGCQVSTSFYEQFKRLKKELEAKERITRYVEASDRFLLEKCERLKKKLNKLQTALRCLQK